MFRYICKDLVKFFLTVFDNIFVLFPNEFNLAPQKWNYSYTNADLQISQYVLIHIQITPWKFRILNPKNSWVIHLLYFLKKLGYFLTYHIVSVCL